MNLDEAIDVVVAKTGHVHYRKLCSDENPNTLTRDQYRKLVMDEATGNKPEPAPREYPSVGQQLRSVAAAASRAVAGAASGNGVFVSTDERNRRMAICLECPELDKSQNRCRICGCSMAVKPWLKAEHCPPPVSKW